MRNLIRGLIAAVLLATLPLIAEAALFVSVTVAPPELPVYEQPPIPGPGYLWTPGYWAWDADASDYYWVPGTWVLAPVGLLWTPGYWGWSDGVYVWNAGYWGPHVGFYGGVNYGYGYGGLGFAGGEWRGGALYYNRAVTNVSTTNITNVYNNTTVVNNTTVNRTSFNGGPGGVSARPTAAEQVAMHERHTPPLQAQSQQRTMASHNPSLHAKVNGGHPAIAATPRPGEFSGRGVVAARNSRAGGFRTAERSTERPAARPERPGGARAAEAMRGETHGAAPQTHGNAFTAPREQPRAPEQPRGGSLSEHPQPQSRGNPPQHEPQQRPQHEPPPQREQRKEREEHPPQPQARATQLARPERMAHTSPARPEAQRVAHASQTHAQAPLRMAHTSPARPEPQRVAHASQTHAQQPQRAAHTPARQAGNEHQHG